MVNADDANIKLKIVLNPPALNNCNIEKTAKICSKTEMTNCSVNRYSYIGNQCFMVNTDIGSFCSIADRVTSGSAQHKMSSVSTSPVFFEGKNVLNKNFSNEKRVESKRTVVENDVWIGQGAFIKSGVTIHNGAVVGMNAVVTHDVGPYEIWAGNPAKMIRKRFDDITIKNLLNINWWSWDENHIRRYSSQFDNPERLINAVNNKKLKILVLTSIYRDEHLPFIDKETNVVNLFAHSWMSLGHEVVVIHNAHKYPAIIYKIPSILREKLEAKIGFQIVSYPAVKRKNYEDNGVKIYRIPILKIIPHSAPAKLQIFLQEKKIINLLSSIDFTPDIIIGHWASPQMELIAKLKSVYDCPTAVVLHGTEYINNSRYHVQRYLKNIDVIGTRSQYMSQSIQQMLGLKKKPFVCYSGVPDEYLESYKKNLGKFLNTEKWKFVFVGRLVAYKNVDVLIKSLSKLTVNWNLEVLGDGGELTNLQNLCKSLGCSDRVQFSGRVSRKQVMKTLSECHCFAMVDREVFGLVYLEAMAASCITVGGKEQGIDGVIEDGKNGFLCEPGNERELTNLLTKITNMENEKLRQIASNGYDTALDFSDSKVAERYLFEVLGPVNRGGYRVITFELCNNHKIEAVA